MVRWWAVILGGVLAVIGIGLIVGTITGNLHNSSLPNPQNGLENYLFSLSENIIGDIVVGVIGVCLFVFGILSKEKPKMSEDKPKLDW